MVYSCDIGSATSPKATPPLFAAHSVPKTRDMIQVLSLIQLSEDISADIR